MTDNQDLNNQEQVDSIVTPDPINLEESNNVPVPPELPPRSDKPLPPEPLSFDLTDGISKISGIRQVEIYSSPQFHEVSELFVNNTLGNDTIKSKIDGLKNQENEDIKYWINIIEDYSNQFLKEGIDELEQKIITGIPDEVRYLVYLKTLQVRYKLTSKESFSGLLTKARYASEGKYDYIEHLEIDSNVKDLLVVLDYLVNDVNKNHNNTGESTRTNLGKFLINCCTVVNQIENATSEEKIYILLKLNKLYSNLIKEELFYKINRTLEDQLTDVFKHITLQGITLNSVYKEVLGNFFHDYFEDSGLPLKILDFVIFEGFDFILRLLVWVFTINKEKFLQFEGDELLNLVHSKQLFTGSVNFQEILNVQPEVIKYENEFHLIHANSFNSNRNELTNLREINDDLMIKVSELKQKIDTLQTTHQEIMTQSKEFEQQLDSAKQENANLVQIKQELKQKYEDLTMKENLQNTIKANQEFSERNSELQQQIDEVKLKIEEMKNKLSKVSPVPVESS